MSSRRKPRWRLQLESMGAGLVSSALVAGSIGLMVRFGLLEYTSSVRWVMVLAGSMTGVIVAAQYLKNRGIDS